MSDRTRRPRAESVYNIQSVGPNDFTETKTYYWVPGRKQKKASNPVLSDKSPTVTAASRDALMGFNSFKVKNMVFISEPVRTL